ncbi:MAG: PIN domain-containing protein [Gemmatimonadota bacterium]|nr:PIN domain-containing protein [Gemmatimonadota bacterium]
MILADTSVWVDHFRGGNPTLRRLLEAGEVSCHSFVIGELACGTLRRGSSILELLGKLPAVPSAEDFEVLELIDAHRLMGRGLGWVDVHLLAAALISGVSLWTLDKPLLSAAQLLSIRAELG